MTNLYTGILDFFLNDTSSPDNLCIETFNKWMTNIIKEFINNTKFKKNEKMILHFISDNTFTNIGNFNYKFYMKNITNINIVLNTFFENVFFKHKEIREISINKNETPMYEKPSLNEGKTQFLKTIYIFFLIEIQKNIKLFEYNNNSNQELKTIIYKMYNDNDDNDLYIFKLIKEIKIDIINKIITNINNIYDISIQEITNIYISEYSNFINTNLIFSDNFTQNIQNEINFFRDFDKNINLTNIQKILNEININDTYLDLLINKIKLDKNDKIIILSTKYDIYNLYFMNDEQKQLLQYYIKLFNIIINYKKNGDILEYKEKLL
jgi:hypothetical protein